MLTPALVLYAAGVVIGLLRVDAGPLTRVVVALLWPVGVLAGVVTLSLLLLAAMVLFPIFGAAVVVAAIAVAWLFAGG